MLISIITLVGRCKSPKMGLHSLILRLLSCCKAIICAIISCMFLANCSKVNWFRKKLELASQHQFWFPLHGFHNSDFVVCGYFPTWGFGFCRQIHLSMCSTQIGSLYMLHAWSCSLAYFPICLVSNLWENEINVSYFPLIHILLATMKFDRNTHQASNFLVSD